MDKRRVILQRLIGTAFALCLWQLAAVLVSQRLALVSPLEVIARLAVLCRDPGFFPSILFSLKRILQGFMLGLAAGIAAAVLSGHFQLVDALLRPFVVTMKTVPVASFIVLSIIWLGAKRLGVFISFVMVFPIIYTNMLQGIRGCDPQMLEMARVFDIPARRKLIYIYIPETAPYLISGCTVALGLAWKAGIAAEVIGIPAGSIGERLYLAKLYYDTADLLSWTVVIVAVSVLMEKLFIALLKLALRGVRRL